MGKLKYVVLLLAILSLALIGGVWRFAGWRQRYPETIQLWVPPAAFDMGTVWESDHFAWTVPVENREPAAIEVESFSSTCNCLSIQPKSFVLAPGERQELSLQIDLSGRPKPAEEVAVELSPKLKQVGGNGGDKVAPEWTLRARIRRILTIERHVFLGRHSELSQPLPAWIIPFEALVPLKELSAECDVAGLAA